MFRFERQRKKSMLMEEIKEMKSMINQMMKPYYMGSGSDDHLDVHQDIIALNKTSEELEAMGQVLVSKQCQASDHLNLALIKLTQIAMRYSSSNQRTTSEQNIAYENAKMMAEDKKTEAENLQRRIVELEKQKNDKKAMELEIEQLRETLNLTKRVGFEENLTLKKEIDELKRKLMGEKELDELVEEVLVPKETENLENEHLKQTLNAMKNMGGVGSDENFELKNEIDELNRKLLENEELLESKEAMNKILIAKELSINDELQEARKELIFGLRGMSSSLVIGVKTMGELDLKPFLDVSSKLNCPAEEALTRSIQLCWTWREHLKDPNWHPFKIVKVGDKVQEILDEEDEKLKSLKELGHEEVYKAVTTAVMEMNQYNPNGREPVQEIWNFKEGKRATLKEGISFMSRMSRIYLRRI